MATTPPDLTTVPAAVPPAGWTVDFDSPIDGAKVFYVVGSVGLFLVSSIHAGHLKLVMRSAGIMTNTRTDCILRSAEVLHPRVRTQGGRI